MKKTVQTTVRWSFSLAPVDMKRDRRVIVSIQEGDKVSDMILGEIIIHSLFRPHPAGGRCAFVTVSGIHLGGKEVRTKRFIGGSQSLLFGPSERLYRAEGDGYYWSLHRGEEFLDGALRIGQLILETLGAKCQSNWLDHKGMLGSFEIRQQTFVLMSGRVWRPLEYYLCVERGWKLYSTESI